MNRARDLPYGRRSGGEGRKDEIPFHDGSLAAGCLDGGLQPLRHSIPAGEPRQRSSQATAGTFTMKSN